MYPNKCSFTNNHYLKGYQKCCFVDNILWTYISEIVPLYIYNCIAILIPAPSHSHHCITLFSPP